MLHPAAKTQTKACLLLFLVSAFALPQIGRAQSSEVNYTVNLSKSATQRVGVSMTFDLSGELAGRETVDVLMPAWRPGRYVILDPAGGVVRLAARDGQGQVRAARKIDKATWRVESRGARRLTIEYELYANSLGMRTLHADDSHAFLSGSAVFLYVPELRFKPLEVEFEAPRDWAVAGGLEALAGSPQTVTAPTFDVLIDSPIEVGLHDRIDFDVAGVPHEIVIWPQGRRVDRERLIKDFSSIIESQLEIFGGFPYQRYVFLVHAGAGAGGGTEHLNSTIMQVPSSRLEGSVTNDNDYRRFLGLVSHEFFHTWNVKQIRPDTMAPYDLQNENYSTLFWVAEGTTSYYDSLTLARTKLVKVNKYLEELGELVDGSRKQPGTLVQSLSDSSYDAWVKFNRRTPDSANTTVSFYGQGALASLFLDLEMRADSDDALNLDQVMRSLYERFPLADGGYSRSDLENTVRRISGKSRASFFERFIDGVEPLPLEQAFEHVGLELYLKPDKARNGAKADDDSEESTDEDDESTDDASSEDASTEDKAPRVVADSGARLTEASGKAQVRSVRAGSAFYQAGVLPGDELVALGGRRITVEDWDALVESFEPGGSITLHYVRHGELRSMQVKLDQRQAATWKLKRVKDPTDQQKTSYEAWLGQPWPKDKDEKDDDQESKESGS